MNLLSTILDRLNQRIEVGNIFDKIYGLSELVGEGNDKAWAYYIGNGQAVPVTDFDAKQGTLFWAKRGKITVAKNDSLRLAGCKSIYETKFSMTAYAMVRKSHLPCDSADAQDWVASRVLRLISGTDPQFKTAIGVIAYEVVPNGYQNEIRYLPVNYEWAAVAIDVDVNVSTSSEDGCYDTCATGDIPLPDFEPCTPCLTEVAVDGVTITGNGTPEDPLIAVGGGGGGSLTVRDEGTIVASGVVNMNFRGGAVNANSSTAGSVNIDVQEVQLTEGTGIDITGTYPSFTIANTLPDQTVVLTEGAGIDITGTYPNFTIAATGGTGTVTSVTGTAPIASSGGTTPDISITQADTTTDGYLSSADWNTFDGKFDTPTGTSSEYIDGTGALQTFPALGMQGGQASGTDTYTVSITGVTAYNLNDAYAIGFTNANTGASTLNINGLGAVNIAKNNTVPIIGGDIQANQQFIAIYDGTNFQLLGIAPNQMFAYVTNADSVTINRGQPVYSFGATGDRMTVKLANNSSEATSSRTLGLVFSTSIGANQKGFIITQGVIDGLNTNAYSPGDVLYVGNTAGSLTNVLPLAPRHYTRVGIVERANSGNGQIYVHVQNGFQLDELSDVDITTVTPVNNDFLVYTTGASNLWKNRSLGNVLGGTTAQYVRGDGSLATMPSGFLRNEYIASSAASIDVPIPVGYSHHKIFMVDITAGTANSELWHRVGIGSPSVIQSGAGNYSHYRILSGSSTALASTGSAADTKMVLLGAAMPTGSSGQAFNGNYTLYNPDSTTLKKQVNGNISTIFNSGLFVGGTIHGLYNATDAVTSLRFQCSAGNISGKIIIESYL
jgi:hypothetical protein